MVRKALIGAVMIVALFAAPAAAQYNSFTVNPGSVSSGGTANYNGNGCQPGEAVTLTIDGTTVATTNADDQGNYQGTFVVNLPDGEYTVTSTCGDVVKTAPLSVKSNTATQNPGTGSTGTLPRTGSNLDNMGLIGAGLLLAGGAVMLATRKRQAA